MEDDSINGSQLIHQNVVGRRSSQWAASLKWKNKCDEEKEDCKKWNEQTFFLFMFFAEGLWCGCSEWDHKTYLGGFGKQFNELLRLFTTINRLWSRQYSTMIAPQKQPKPRAQRETTTKKCRKLFYFPVSCVGSSLWLVRVSVLFANGWCGCRNDTTWNNKNETAHITANFLSQIGKFN